MRAVLIASLCGVVLLWTTATGRCLSKRKPAPPKQIVWEQLYGDKKRWHEYQGIAASPDRTVWLVATVHLPHETSNSIRLWEITTAGTTRRDFTINRQHTAIRALTVLDSTHLLLIVDFVANQPWLVQFNTETQDIFAKELGSPSQRLTIRKMIPTAQQTFLLLGHEASDAVAIKINAQGVVLWEKTFDRSKTELFVDGLALRDGSFVLVGNSGEYDLFHAGPSLVWVGRYDTHGNLLTEATFAGRYGSITRIGQGTYAIVYDSGDHGQQEIRVQALNSDLKTTWNTKLLEVEHSLHYFKIAALSSGALLVVGAKENQPYITQISGKGKQQWEFWGRKMPRAMSYDLLVAYKSVLVPSSIFTEFPVAGGSIKSTKKVRVLRVKVH